uniref:RNA-directed RNA polymerase n=1 Tax=Riboviria sp. TaxID=2585031 RepID=A0A514D2V0_9VIRU|nr:MAG: RNA-dependent RNA polymerase [Riboviria sp.]
MVVRRYEADRWDLHTTALSYKGALRRRYLVAEDSLMKDGPITARDVLLRAFLKAEKCNVTSKPPKPRMIFPRDPRYNLELASWLKPLEHWLWRNLKSVGSYKVSPMRVVAKGLSPGQRANLIVRKWEEFERPICFEVDGKAFEAHVDVWQLREEHQVYQTAYGGRESGLMKLLRYQLRNFGITSGGVRFEREGGRASGDFNTGMGNSLIMAAVIDGVMRGLRIRYASLVDGDNALIFLDERDASRVVGCFAARALKISGHEMVLERPVTVIEGIRFGQSAPVQVRGRWTMVREWNKVISQGSCSHAHMHDLRFAPQWLAGVAFCENYLPRGLPLLETWSHTLWRMCGSKDFIKTHLYRDYEILGVPLGGLNKPVVSSIADSTRRSFHRAFGISPDEQKVMEGVLSRGFPSLGRWEPQEPVTFWNRELHHLGW